MVVNLCGTTFFYKCTLCSRRASCQYYVVRDDVILALTLAKEALSQPKPIFDPLTQKVRCYNGCNFY